MPQHHKKKKHSKNKNQQDRTEKANSGCSSTTDRSSLDEEHDSGVGPEELEKRNSDSSASSSSGEILPALPYEIKLSEVMGRYLVAARNLQAGEVVMEELPLAIGPCADSDAVCLGCYGELPSRSKQFKCLGCGWALCGPKCKGLKTFSGHSSWECSKLREHRIADILDKCNSKELRYMYEIILPLRCLLLKSNDLKKWEKLMTMESHNDIRRGMTALWKRNQDVIVNRLRNLWGIKDFTDEEIHTVCGIIEVNSFEVGQNGARARALFPSAFYLAHDCCPNTTHTDHPISHSLTVRVIRKVKKGDPITLSYAYTLQGTLKRRSHLQECKFFWCVCERCTDPTELNSYSSAIQCPKCNSGIILSLNPLQQEAPWKCNSCSYTVKGSSMLLLVDKMYNELDAIDCNGINELEEYLEKYKNVLHPNHYLNISAKHSLCQLYGRTEGHMIQTLTLEQLQRKEKYCRDILKVIDQLDPGLSRLRGVIMYELHAPVMIQASRLYEAKKITSNELRKRLKEVVKLLQCSEEILAFEPDGSSEHTMAVAATDALKRIGKIY